ncbi:MAG: hypothetical protein WC967_09385 [Balneolaceae bacterium]
MQFVAKNKDLHSALTIAKKFAYPATHSVIVVKKDKAYFFIDSIQAVVQTSFPVETVEKEGIAEFDFDLFLGSVKNNNESVSVSTSSTLITIKAGRMKADLPKVDAVDGTPKLKAPESGVSFPKSLVEKLDKLIPAITVIDTKLKMESAIHFRFDKGKLNIMSASFAEMAQVCVEAPKQKETIEFSVTSKLFSLIRSASAKSKYKIRFNDNFMYVDLNDGQTLVKLEAYSSEIQPDVIEAKVSSILEQTPIATVKVNPKDFSELFKNKQAFIGEQTTAEITVKKDKLLIEIQGPQGAVIQQQVPVKKSKGGKDELFSFFPSILAASFNRLKDADCATLEFYGPAMFIRSTAEEEKVNFLIMRV